MGGLLEIVQLSSVPGLSLLLFDGPHVPVLSGFDYERNPKDLILYGCQLRKIVLGRENRSRCLGC